MVQCKKTSRKLRENMISQKINDYCLIMWPMTLYFPHTLRALRLFQNWAFSCHVCSAPSWGYSDASFIAPKLSPEQGDSSTAESHEEHQLHCETLSFKYNLFCGVALWQSWEFERHTHKKKNPSLATGLLGCGLGLTIKLSAWNILSLWKHEIYDKSFCENWSS